MLKIRRDEAEPPGNDEGGLGPTIVGKGCIF